MPLDAEFQKLTKTMTQYAPLQARLGKRAFHPDHVSFY